MMVDRVTNVVTTGEREMSEELKRNQKVLEAIERALAAVNEARRMLDEAGDVEQDPPLEILRDVVAKVKRKECLQCHKPYRKTGGRGLCESCYNATQNLVRKGDVTFAMLVARGALKPLKLNLSERRGKGKEATELDRIVEEIRAEKLAVDVAKPSARKPAKKR